MAAISKFKMAATLLDMQFSKRDRCRLHWLLYLHFVLVQMAAIFNFTMTVAFPVLFSVTEYSKTPDERPPSPTTIPLIRPHFV